MMNIFSKIIASILLFGIVQNTFPQEMIYKIPQKTDHHFYDGNVVRDFLNQRTAFDTLWLPVSMIEKGSSGNPHLFK